jgi:hypothetical protein
MLEDPEPGAAIVVGENVTVTPVGWPLAVKDTAPLNPPDTVLVIVDAPFPPCATDTEPGEADKLKLGDVDPPPASAVIKAAPFGLPNPVAKSNPAVAEAPLLPEVMSWKSVV